MTHDIPESRPKDTRKKPGSQKAAEEIARLMKLKAQWEKFETPGELHRRRLRQAEILGVAMWTSGARVPAEWHKTMEKVAAQHEASDGGESENPDGEEKTKDEPKGLTWLVSKEQLEADGWRFEGDRLHMPPKD